MHHPSPPEFDRGIGSLLHLESHPARGHPYQTLTGPPKTSTAQERPSTSGGDDDDNMGTSVWVSTSNLEPIMIRPILRLAAWQICSPKYPPVYADPVPTHFTHFSGVTKPSADCQLTYQLSLLGTATYFYTPPDCSEVPRVFPRALPSLNHPPRLCAAARHTSSILAS
jgi:hypothetical protein